MDSKKYKDICKQTWFNLLIDNSFMFYKKHDVLENHLKILKQEEFDTYVFNCTDWVSVNCFEKDYVIKISKGNLQSFDKNLPDKEGHVFIFQNFEEYFLNYYEEAVKTLDTINRLERQYLLFGKKLIVLLNSNNNLFNEKFSEMDNPPVRPIRWLNGDCSY